MKIVKREKSTSTKGHYITNAVLLPEVIRAKSLGRVTDELAHMLMMIAERYSRKSNFAGYSFREDMVSAALVNLCNSALKFDPAKSSNPFSFYTTAIHNSFLPYMAHEKKHRNIRDTLLVDAGANPSFNFLEKEKDEQMLEVCESDEIVYPDETDDSPDDLPESTGAEDDVDAAILKKPKRMLSARYKDRLPGAVTVYKAKDIVIDETGNITVKQKSPKKKASTTNTKKPKSASAKSVLAADKTKKTPPAKKSTSSKRGRPTRTSKASVSKPD